MIVRALDPPAIDDGDVWVADGRIAHPGTGIRIDCSGKLVVPGNVCAHTHLYSALARGMPYALEPPVNFLEILQRVWWRLDRALDLGSIRASALVGGMEALLSGTTTLFDHHASPNAIDGSLDLIAEALESLGIRSVLCYETSDRDGAARAGAGVAENRRFLASSRPLTRGMVGAHASFTLSDETLLACAEAGPLHVHAAEDAVDTGAVARLDRLGALDGRTLLAHGIHVDDDEVALFGASGATLAHNARSNMNNAVGRARVLDLGPRVALGTDGIGADMFAEAQAAFLAARDHGHAFDPLAALGRNWSLAASAFDAGLGRIEPGCPADLVVLAYDPPTPLDETNLFGHLLFGPGASSVRDLLVAGKLVVRDRRVLTVDEPELAARARAVAARLWQRMA